MSTHDTCLIGGAKLLASILGNEEDLVGDLVARLMDVQLTLKNIFEMDSSLELSLICKFFLVCNIGKDYVVPLAHTKVFCFTKIFHDW